MDKQQIIDKLKSSLDLEEVHVMTNDGSHFQVIAIGELFADLSRVKKQQAIYAPLAEFINDNRIHALSIKTYTPTEWQRERKLMGL
ncbi:MULTISPECIES: BolA family protein [unclassified Gilliamella]|uniref:BolA family protein n=1 Tax=unclassified Gilliamella TaxID=2685620 RepID=UPI001C6970A7|nr:MULTISPECIES: BolA family protein [unclassified Gilliamella]MCX8573983.1 BolA family transcriptional regulator [Gilliamella sp. B3831]MCX8576214.1 BolA family transcriptional regulator [Gilliamella sp. B3815]MCX8588122.1 BolA family transcriptional regulator [Gilliamella sp. B3801]MCX8593064.1 BolA family transcriptional regulator [Gilliamella sp. B3804]MCX8603315.1 BolA family transcriptional regulator [Gilliamella sp. B3823]